MKLWCTDSKYLYFVKIQYFLSYFTSNLLIASSYQYIIIADHSFKRNACLRLLQLRLDSVMICATERVANVLSKMKTLLLDRVKI